MTMLRAPERVLPTLNQDGTRRWIRPRHVTGKFERRRLAVGWALIATFCSLPFVRVGGKPAVLLDVVHREFTLFGRTFLATDGVLLMLLMLSILVGIILLTALVGRAWCGWGCPQTVYMELLFRPIERLIEGDHRKQARLDRDGANLRRVLKYAVFAVVSAIVGNVFLSYFVGVHALATWMRHSPLEHQAAFLVMGVTAALVFIDFAYFREQMCTVVCPYARLQSVLLDKKSLVVAYDPVRGEPRGKKGKTSGDCVDCGVCVDVCPTGIDIRNGLQLECITCAQCIDGCDAVMDKLKRPRGLIRYTSEDALATRKFSLGSLIRARVLVYPILLVGLVTALVVSASGRKVAEVSLLRGIGAPFVQQGDEIRNLVRIKIRNRTSAPAAFALALVDGSGSTLVAPENPVAIAAGEQTTESVFILSPRTAFVAGKHPVSIRVTTSSGFEQITPYTVLGPYEVAKQ
jgi:cytochrome c oxidase accessory protein FixG